MEKAPPRTAGDVLARSRDFLSAKAIDGSRLEAELLVAHSLGLDRLGLFMALDRPVVPAEIDRARELVVRRSKGEPTAYLLGYREFYGRKFNVTPDVLIPRPETELLVYLARAFCAARDAEEGPRIVDFGAGSGCIGLTLALEVEDARVLAIEKSAAAAEVARANATKLDVPKERFGVQVGDGFQVLSTKAGVDLLVCNPPYIDRLNPQGLADDVKQHEPALALFGPDGDPDWFARTLFQGRERYLLPNGRAFVELGFDQAERIAKWIDGADAQIHKDLAGIPRVLEFGR